MSQNFQKQPDYTQWPTKEQASAILECSTKTVEAFAAQGKLQTIRWRRPSGGPKIAVYHPADVERLRRERFPDSASTFLMPATSENSERSEKTLEADATRSVVAQFLNALQAVMPSQKLLGVASETSQKPEVPLYHRVYLTVREASAYAGLPERRLRQKIASGQLPANRDGYTRVRRIELDKL